MSATIRPATAADIAAVRDLLVRTWHATYDDLFGAQEVTEITDRWHSHERLTAELEQAVTLVLVADEAGAITGTPSATRIADTTVVVNRLYVAPEMQGKGIGRALYEALHERFPSIARITLEVEPRNTSAIKFYESLGFAAVGGGKNCGGDAKVAIPHLIMERRFS